MGKKKEETNIEGQRKRDREEINIERRRNRQEHDETCTSYNSDSLHFEGGCPHGQRQKLMTQTNAKQGLVVLATHQLTHCADGRFTHHGVSWPITQKYTVIL